MPAVATEKWSGPSKSRAVENGDTATKLWEVVGADTQDGAMDAVEALGITRNSEYKPGSNLKCNGLNARSISPVLHEVTATYAIPPNGEWVTPEEDDDPLDEPAEIQWQTVIITEPFDMDIDGNAVVNSSGDPPNSMPTRTFKYRQLTITKNAAFYDLEDAATYENKINSDTVTLTLPDGGSISYPAGTVKCVTIQPARSYKATATYVPMQCSFELWDLGEVATTRPHDCRFLDQGSEGWYLDPVTSTRTKGLLCTSKGDMVSGDKLLDGTGKPIDVTLKIRDGAGNIQTPVSKDASPANPPGAEEESSGGVIFLRYRKYKAIALNTFINGLA